jgi:hypothetical protein
MVVAYVGPDNLPPDQPALFVATVSNSVNYYQEGPAGGKYRPGWTIVDESYAADMKALALASLTETLDFGLAIVANGQPLAFGELMFYYFGKTSEDVLLELWRGPTEFEYPAVKMTFGTVHGF